MVRRYHSICTLDLQVASIVVQVESFLSSWVEKFLRYTDLIVLDLVDIMLL